jgi:hypothetical protein
MARASLNKEKVAFLAATLLTCVALYVFLTSGPSPLVLSSPSTREPGPDPEPNFVAIHNKPVNELIDGGGRESPFYPVRPPVDPPTEKRVVDGGANPPIDKGDGVPKKKDFSSGGIDSQVDYMGVTVVDGEPHGLLKPKNGAKPFLVTKGESIPVYSCTVMEIEPQAIQIEDNDNRRFVLKDSSYNKKGRAR